MYTFTWCLHQFNHPLPDSEWAATHSIWLSHHNMGFCFPDASVKTYEIHTYYTKPPPKCGSWSSSTRADSCLQGHIKGAAKLSLKRDFTLRSSQHDLGRCCHLPTTKTKPLLSANSHYSFLQGSATSEQQMLQTQIRKRGSSRLPLRKYGYSEYLHMFSCTCTPRGPYFAQEHGAGEGGEHQTIRGWVLHDTNAECRTLVTAEHVSVASQEHVLLGHDCAESWNPQGVKESRFNFRN